MISDKMTRNEAHIYEIFYIAMKNLDTIKTFLKETVLILN